MEERKILDKIWSDIDKFGWKKVKLRKREYLALYGDQNNSAPIYNAIDEVMKNAEDQETILCSACGLPPVKNVDPLITYGCGECGKQFGDRLSLFNHYEQEHKEKTSL